MAMRRIFLPLIGAIAVSAAGAAIAQTGQPADVERDGRFSMTPAPDGGFLRLDTRTGAVSHCRTSNNGVQCRSAADERAALQAEIDRLAGENAELRRKMAQAAPGDRLRNALPGDKELDAALNWMERFARRMMRVFREEAPADRI
jgi:hypothetical protein